MSWRRAIGRRWVWVVGGGSMLLALGLMSLVSAGAAEATSEPGSGLGSYQLSAEASGLQASYATAGSTSATAEGEVPYADSLLDSIPFGEGLASVAWPGAIPANAGTTAVVLGAPIPGNDANDLNDPMRAQAETGSQSTVTNDSYPGTTMAATATSQQVTAEGRVDSTLGPDAGFSTGDISAASSATLTGVEQAEVKATSQANNLLLAGGLIAIKSVISDATATTDGVTAKASGDTVLSGVTVDGAPASIDQSGLHLQSTGASPSPLVKAANQALAAADVEVLPVLPAESTSGGQVSYTAAGVLITWSPGGSGLFTVDLGGVSVSASATPGYGRSTEVSALGPSAGGTSPAVTLLPGATAGSIGTAQGAGASEAPSSGELSADRSPSGSGTSAALPSGPPSASPSGPGGKQSLLAAVSKPVSPGWIAMATLASLLIAGGLVGAPERLLGDSTSTCLLEESYEN